VPLASLLGNADRVCNGQCLWDLAADADPLQLAPALVVDGYIGAARGAVHCYSEGVHSLCAVLLQQAQSELCLIEPVLYIQV
jgi:hypothetical protein